MANKIFINLPVKDLEKSVEFFTKLGFKFNPQFTDQNAACMIVCDAKKSTEVLIALPAESREKVDEMMNAGIAASGKEAIKPQDYGWMYGRGLEDIDGHIWEFIYMDMDAMPPEMKNKK